MTLRGLNPARHAQRRAALLEIAGGRPIVIFGMGSALGGGTRSHGGLRFLTGWDSHESASLLLLTRAGCRLLLTSPFMEPSARDTVPELTPAYVPQSQWPQAVAEALQGMKPALIGAAEMPMGLYQPLAKLFDHAEDFTPVLDGLRQVKDADALTLHKAGAAICDAVFAALPKAVAIGRSGAESQRILDDLALSLGAEYCRTWLTLRPQADHPRYWPEETQRRAEIGDQMLFGVALTVDGHWAHGLRMGQIGPVPAPISAMHSLVYDALQHGIAALQPGLSISECVRAMDARVRDVSGHLAGRVITGFRAGHGLGLTYEEPGLTSAFPQKFGQCPEPIPSVDGPILRSGMVLELHPNIFASGLGGAALGQMLQITESGAVSLLKAPTDLIVL
jgi:Xaa-Pro aminopeptidase